MTTITVPSRFNGPPASGNGGYSCGTLAAHLEGPAAVSLRRPVPLDEPLEVRLADGAARAFGDGGELIAEAVTAALSAPWSAPPVSPVAARQAKELYASPADSIFGHCFVCGRSRADGLAIFAGPVAGTDLVASPWTPPAWTAGADGAVRAEFIWAALDCPTYFALHGTTRTRAYLARQQVEVSAPPRAGVECVVVGRPLERSGRKGLAAAAILDPDGTVLAHGECLHVVPREEAR